METDGVAHERRWHRRALITVPIKLYCRPPRDEAVNGVTHNVSDTGIGVYIENSLDDGMPVIIRSRAVGEDPRHGVIRWCKKISERLYRVGVTLTG